MGFKMSVIISKQEVQFLHDTLKACQAVSLGDTSTELYNDLYLALEIMEQLEAESDNQLLDSYFEEEEDL